MEDLDFIDIGKLEKTISKEETYCHVLRVRDYFLELYLNGKPNPTKVAEIACLLHHNSPAYSQRILEKIIAPTKLPPAIGNLIYDLVNELNAENLSEEHYPESEYTRDAHVLYDLDELKEKIRKAENVGESETEELKILVGKARTSRGKYIASGKANLIEGVIKRKANGK